MKVIPETGRAH